MSTLVVLDYCTTCVLFIRLTDEMVKKLVDEYENNSEAWIADSGLEEQFGFRVSDSNWMICDDTPEMFQCYPNRNEKIQVFNFM